MNKPATCPLKQHHRVSSPGSASEDSRSTRGGSGGLVLLPSKKRRTVGSAAKWISRVLGLFFLVFAMLLQSGCIVAGEKEVDPRTGYNRTAVVAMLGTDAGTMPMPYRNADGTLAEATEVNQSTSTKTVATGVVGGMAVQAYRAVQTGAQGVEKALSKDAAGVTKAVDGNATKVLINDSNNALKEVELLSGQ